MDEGWCRLTLSSIKDRGVLNLKRIQIHTFDFGTSDKTRWLGGRVQVWVEVPAPAGHLAITPEGYSRRPEGFDCTINGRALGTALRHGLGGSDRRAQTQGVSESASIAVGRNRLAWGKRATTTDSVHGFNDKFRDESFFFSMRNEIFARSCCRPKPRPSLRSILRSFIGIWVEIWHRNKTACSESNPVQSSRSLNRRPVREKGVCSDSNRTAQRLQMVARKILETISDMILIRPQPKFSAKSVANEMRSLQAKQWPALTGRALIFDLKICWAISLCIQSSSLLQTNHP